MKRREVLVIDDSARFALHVWRYLTGSLGFGNGEVGGDGRWLGSSEEPIWIGEKKPILSADGCLQIWWICAREGALERLDEIFKCNHFGKKNRFYALVDIHGARGYSAPNVYSWLEKRKEQRADGSTIRLVSAYHTGHRLTATGNPLPVLPKSRETLRRMAGDLFDEPKSPAAPPRVRHVLVTGAGFEIRSDRGGLGMPITAEVFGEMRNYLKDSASLTLAPPEEGSGTSFLIPSDGIWKRFKLRERLTKLAAHGGLDAYWDFVLKEENQNLLKRVEKITVQKRDEVKAKVLWRERCLREAFRRSLLHHDWGFMNQSLDAAQLPLHAWLTTNYTQFADRAISVYSKAPSNLGMWRVIATAAEARTLIRERVSASHQKSRYLFKLHGDIAHLETMAIAGHDKDTFSPLSMPVEDLYQVYAAAETFLRESLFKEEPKLIVWHIVGHGLQDRRLCELLANVWLHTPEVSHVFAVVNPEPSEPCSLLRETLRRLKAINREPVEGCALKAAEYMSRLSLMLRGGDEEFPELKSAEEVTKWLSAVVARNE